MIGFTTRQINLWITHPVQIFHEHIIDGPQILDGVTHFEIAQFLTRTKLDESFIAQVIFFKLNCWVGLNWFFLVCSEACESVHDVVWTLASCKHVEESSLQKNQAGARSNSIDILNSHRKHILTVLIEGHFVNITMLWLDNDDDSKRRVEKWLTCSDEKSSGLIVSYGDWASAVLVVLLFVDQVVFEGNYDATWTFSLIFFGAITSRNSNQSMRGLF